MNALEQIRAALTQLLLTRGDFRTGAVQNNVMLGVSLLAQLALTATAPENGSLTNAPRCMKPPLFPPASAGANMDRGIQEIKATPIEAFQRASDLFQSGKLDVVVIESVREPGKYFVETGSLFLRNYERIIWQNGKAI